MWKIVKKKNGKYVTIQIHSVESVSDENLLVGVQRWELFLSPLIKLNVDVFTQMLLHMDHIGKKNSCSSSMFRTWLEPDEFVNTITQ